MYNPTIHLPPLGHSDHQCLLLVPKQKEKLAIYGKRGGILTPGNLAVLSRKVILEDGSDVYSVEEIDEKVKAFTSTMLTIMDQTIPERTVRMHPSDKPWMTSFIKTKIKARQRVFSRNDLEQYEQLRVIVSKLISKAKMSYYKSNARGLRTTNVNPAKWFKSIFSLLGIHNGNNSLGQTSDDNIQELAEKLQQVFIEPWENLPSGNELDVNQIDRLLKNTTPPLPSIVENNFRKISVLPQLAKVTEKLQIEFNISDLNIKNNQHAFTRDRSTVSALISTTKSWYNATDNSQSRRKGVHVTFIDFRKAFDLVNHNILLEKLASMNVSKSFWLWIKSFLTGRTQQVNLRGILSSIQPSPSGVPQGSVISPTLFNVHINDLEDAVPNHVNIDTCKYADDCTQYQIVERGTCTTMQEAVDGLRDGQIQTKWS